MWLRRNAPAAPMQSGPSWPEPTLAPERRRRARTEAPGDRVPGTDATAGVGRNDRDDARDQPYVSPSRAGGITDAGGSMSASCETGALYFGEQGVHGADDILSTEDMAHLARQRWRNRFFWRTIASPRSTKSPCSGSMPCKNVVKKALELYSH